jgi:hypothetical protein
MQLTISLSPNKININIFVKKNCRLIFSSFKKILFYSVKKKIAGSYLSPNGTIFTEISIYG